MSFPRYEKYKDSGVPWLGEVPEHWQLKPLKRLTKCLDGLRIPLNGEERSHMLGDIPYWGANNIMDYVNDWLFDEEIVLLGEDGAPFFDRTKPVSFVSSGRAWINNHIHVLKANPAIQSKLLAHQLNSVDFMDYIDGSTRDKLTQGKMKEIPCLLPPFEEQNRIVAFLDEKAAEIDAAIGKKERLIALLEEQKQILINQAVTQGLDPAAPKKDSGIPWIGQIPAHWEVKRGKYLLKEIDERSVEGLEELLSVSHMTGVTPRSEKNVNMFMAEDYSGSKVCRQGDLVMNIMWAWMGALGVSNQTGIVSPSYGVFRPRQPQQFNSWFLEQLLRSKLYVSEYNKRSTGLHSSRLRLYADVFLAMELIYPDRAVKKKLRQG